MRRRASLLASCFLLAAVTGLAPAAVGSVDRVAAQAPDLPDFGASSVSAESPTDAWVVGNTADEAISAHWDGVRWTQVPIPGADASFVHEVLALSPTDAWASGGSPGFRQRFLHWDGTAWSTVAKPKPKGLVLRLAASSPTDIWASGLRKTDDFGNRALVEHWDGTSWSVLPPLGPRGDHDTSIESLSVLGPNDLWALEFHHDLGTGQQTYQVVHYDGSTWTSTLRAPDLDALEGVTAISSSDVWAVGYSYDDQGRPLPLAEHWDGRAWIVVPTPGPGYLTDVDAVSPTDVWAIGGVQTDDHPRTIEVYSLHWDGSAWTRLPIKGERGPRDYLNSLSADASNDAWAVGYSANRAIISHWDGATWS